MVGGLAVGEVERTHECAEVAPRVGLKVPHDASTLETAVCGFLGSPDETDQPQPC